MIGPAGVKALTIRQPWASLIALGVKRIETRSWSTSYRGPLAIHAGKNDRLPKAITVAEWATLVEPLAGTPLLDCKCGDALSDHCGDGRCQRCYCKRAMTSWPLGAVVAVADLVDVVPIVGDNAFDAKAPYVRTGGPLVYRWANAAEADDDGGAMLVDDQRPFGDFAPGRFAWLLDNVQPLDPPVPAKGRQGLWEWAP